MGAEAAGAWRTFSPKRSSLNGGTIAAPWSLLGVGASHEADATATSRRCGGGGSTLGFLFTGEAWRRADAASASAAACRR